MGTLKGNKDAMSAPRTQSSIHIHGLNRDERRSAFSPYRSSTVLTNLQRGNVKKETNIYESERSNHQLAAQGELFLPSFNSSFDPFNFNINELDDDGLTLLHWAAAYGQLSTVKRLIEHGADLTITGNNGETVLHFAAAHGHFHVLKELLQQELDVDCVDENGNTPLMYAVNSNNAHCVSELLKSGADFTMENDEKETAYSLSISKKCKEAQAMIERFILNKFIPQS